MSGVVVGSNYASYQESDWTQHCVKSHQGPSGSTFQKYGAYTISLHFNYLIFRLDTLVQTLLSKVGIQYRSRWAWWNPLTANLYLGALPLIQKLFGKIMCNDADTLAQLGIGAVLSVTEPFENNAQGLFLSAVTPEQWQNKNIKHLQLSTPDFQTISMDKINEGVEFIRWNIREGRSVYVHCKAGRGRSALIALCYLMKYHKMSKEEALKELKERREQVSIKGDKWETATRYEELLIAQNKNE